LKEPEILRFAQNDKTAGTLTKKEAAAMIERVSHLQQLMIYGSSDKVRNVSIAKSFSRNLSFRAFIVFLRSWS
jgi:hypothetical protein